jgi:hypothetical protein
VQPLTGTQLLYNHNPTFPRPSSFYQLTHQRTEPYILMIWEVFLWLSSLYFCKGGGLLFICGVLETPIRRITLLSSLHDITTDQLGYRVVVWGRGVTPPALTPLYSRFLDRYVKTTWTVFLYLGYWLLGRSSGGSSPSYISSSWNISVVESAHIAAVLDVFEVSTASTQRQKAWVFNVIKPGLITSSC